MAEKIVRMKKNLFCLKILFIFFYLTNSKIYGHQYRKQRKNNGEEIKRIRKIFVQSETKKNSTTNHY